MTAMLSTHRFLFFFVGWRQARKSQGAMRVHDGSNGSMAVTGCNLLQRGGMGENNGNQTFQTGQSESSASI
jgi:hypothetical protein